MSCVWKEEFNPFYMKCINRLKTFTKRFCKKTELRKLVNITDWLFLVKNLLLNIRNFVLFQHFLCIFPKLIIFFFQNRIRQL